MTWSLTITGVSPSMVSEILELGGIVLQYKYKGVPIFPGGFVIRILNLVGRFL